MRSFYVSNSTAHQFVGFAVGSPFGPVTQSRRDRLNVRSSETVFLPSLLNPPPFLATDKIARRVEKSLGQHWFCKWGREFRAHTRVSGRSGSSRAIDVSVTTSDMNRVNGISVITHN